MSSRKLSDCSIPMQAALAEFENLLRGGDIDFVRACTYRSIEEQNALYELGRSSPGRIVTHARGGESRHNDTGPQKSLEGIDMHNLIPASNAADYYPLMHGKLCGETTDKEIALWRKIGLLGRHCGLEWGGDWPTPKRDMPHFQLAK
jgi:peptidoglycan L-alanyl-D-glutamate endopeptidase CwlK